MTWLGEALWWHRPGSFARTLAYTVAIVVASLIAVRSSWSIDGASMSEGHSLVSLDLAIARAFCDRSSAFSRTLRVPMDLNARMDLRHTPLRSLLVARAGSVEAYCETVDTPFLNNENSLMVMEAAILRLRPDLSLSQLGQVLHLVRIFCIGVFVLLLIDLGASLAFGFATLVSGLMILQALPDHVYSAYPFLFTLVLLSIALHGFAVRHGWTTTPAGLAGYGVAAGLLSAFIVNMRTSYLPVVAAALVLVLIEVLRRGDRSLAWPKRAGSGAAFAACVVAGCLVMQNGIITRNLPDDSGASVAHPFAHPLVLALGVPENDFSRAQGIRWADEVGPQIAERVSPGVAYLSDGYNAALLSYYASLWRTHPREMFGVYYLKLSTAGADMLQVLRRSPGVAGWGVSVLLAPLALLPSGVWLLGVYTLLTCGGLAVYYRGNDPAAFVLALLSLAACLVQLESALIFPIFVKQYQNYAVFYALFISLLGVQVIAQSGSAWLSRLRRKMITPASL